jgi:hypothetical protein
MGRQKKLTLLAAIALGILASIPLVFLAMRYLLSQPEGDATVSDRGFFADYPRYEVRFPNISLKSIGTHTFVCKGLPQENLRLSLEMPDAKKKEREAEEFLRRHPTSKYAEKVYDKKKYEAVRRNRTVIEFTVVADGETKATVVGPLRDWNLKWIPASNTGAFWPEGAELRFSPKVTYQISFVIKEIDPDGMPSEVVPVFLGGGTNWTPH